MLGWSRCEANIRDCSPRLLILSLDTATDIATACVWRDGDALAESATRARSVAAQRVLADVDRLMDEAGVVPADLDMVSPAPGRAPSRAFASAWPRRGRSALRSASR